MFLSYLIFKWKIEANLNKQVIWIHEMSTKFTINRCLRVKRVIEFQFEYLKKKNKKKGKFASLSSSIWISFSLSLSFLFHSSSFLCPLYPDFGFQLPDIKKAHFLYHNNWSFESGSFISSCQYFAWFLTWFHALLLFFWHNLRQAVCLKLFEVNFVWFK